MGGGGVFKEKKSYINFHFISNGMKKKTTSARFEKNDSLAKARIKKNAEVWFELWLLKFFMKTVQDCVLQPKPLDSKPQVYTLKFRV